MKNFNNFLNEINENDPYGEENWEDKIQIYKVREDDLEEIGYVLAHNEAEAKEKALAKGFYEEENKRWVSVELIQEGPYKEMFGKKYEERYELEMERAMTRFNLAKQVVDSLNYCINIKK